MLSERQSKLAAISERSPLQYGKDAYYFRINKKFGFKYWCSKRDALLNYRAQKYANQHGLAPAVGRRLTLHKDGGVYYGFITESAKMLKDERHARKVDELETKLMKLFGTKGHFDMWWKNAGWLNGELVCVDFSVLQYKQTDWQSANGY